MTRGELSRVFANQGQTSVAVPYPNTDFRDKKTKFLIGDAFLSIAELNFAIVTFYIKC
jgi:hypothetical protein